MNDQTNKDDGLIDPVVGCICVFVFVLIGVPLLFALLGLWWQAMQSIWKHF